MMNPAFVKAVTMMAVALPTMFLVIIVFILATKALHKTFPVRVQRDEVSHGPGVFQNS